MKNMSTAVLVMALVLAFLLPQARSQNVANTEPTPLFDFPMQERDFWIYITGNFPICQPWFNQPHRCYYSKLEVTKYFENSSRKCGVFEFKYHTIENFSVGSSGVYFSEGDVTYYRSYGFQLCQEENRLYWFYKETDIESTFSDSDMIADFDRDETQPWIIFYDDYDDYQPYVLRRLIEKSDTEPYEYYFASYLAQNATDLESVFGFEFVESLPGNIREGVGFLSFGYGVYLEHLRASYVSGNVIGDTTFVYPVSIDLPDDLPREIQLSAYPNPFNPGTTINYAITEAGHASVRVYDLHGREVATLVNEVQTAGSHRVQFDASRLSSGIYLVELRSAGQRTVHKITLMK